MCRHSASIFYHADSCDVFWLEEGDSNSAPPKMRSFNVLLRSLEICSGILTSRIARLIYARYARNVDGHRLISWGGNQCEMRIFILRSYLKADQKDSLNSIYIIILDDSSNHLQIIKPDNHIITSRGLWGAHGAHAQVAP
jgi:hypothetical protein